jgi:hypothetical protein
MTVAVMSACGREGALDEQERGRPLAYRLVAARVADQCVVVIDRKGLPVMGQGGTQARRPELAIVAARAGGGTRS